MARLFDNNVANYMSRASVDLGLNGLTEMSIAASIRIDSINGTLRQHVVAKEIDGLNGWMCPKLDVYIATTSIRAELTNNALNQGMAWRLSTGIGLNTWRRVLFTWKRNTIDSADGILYLDGVSVPATFVPVTYTSAFTLQENSSNLMYGLQPVSLIDPFHGALAWVNIWNRQLTAGEAAADFTNPRAVTSGLVSSVEIYPDADSVLGGGMTVTGTLAPFSLSSIARADMSRFPKPSLRRAA